MAQSTHSHPGSHRCWQAADLVRLAGEEGLRHGLHFSHIRAPFLVAFAFAGTGVWWGSIQGFESVQHQLKQTAQIQSLEPFAQHWLFAFLRVPLPNHLHPTAASKHAPARRAMSGSPPKRGITNLLVSVPRKILLNFL